MENNHQALWFHAEFHDEYKQMYRQFLVEVYSVKKSIQTLSRVYFWLHSAAKEKGARTVFV